MDDRNNTKALLRSQKWGPWMENDAIIGWIAAIIVGAIAGWLAEQFMKSNMGLLMNIILGIVGAAIASRCPRFLRHLAGRLDRLFDSWIYRSVHFCASRGCSNATRGDPYSH